MRFVRVIIIACVCVLLGSVGYLALSPQKTLISGYITADTIYLSAARAGQVARLFIQKGQRVAKGDALFHLDFTDIDARLQQAEANILQCRARIEHETAILAQLRENLAITEAEAARTEQDLARYQAIWRKDKGAISQIDIDHARVAVSTAKLQRSATAKEIEGALASISSAEQQLLSAEAEKVRLEREKIELSPASPVEGYVEDIYSYQGEWVNAGEPVVGVVSSNNVVVRFYVAESELASYSLGTSIKAVSSRGDVVMVAKVSYISPKPEFTPPVIYSLESQHKMVFCLEATPNEYSTSYAPGIPVSIERMPIANE